MIILTFFITFFQSHFYLTFLTLTRSGVSRSSRLNMATSDSVESSAPERRDSPTSWRRCADEASEQTAS